MSESTAESAVIKRADTFAHASFYGAIAIFALALVNLGAHLADYFTRVGIAVSSFAPGTPGMIAAVTQRVLCSGVVDGFLVLGAGVLALAAVRAASSERPPFWAVRLDKGFANKALAFARIAEIAAWIYLALNALAAVVALSYRWPDYWPQFFSERSQAFMQVAWDIENVTSSVVSALTTFFTFFLGAMIIRTLVIISSKAPGEAVVSAGGDNTNA